MESLKHSWIVLIVLIVSCSQPAGVNDSSIPPVSEVLEDKCPERALQVAILVSDGVFNTELTAPMDIFQHTQYRCENGMNVYTISQNDLVIKSFEGLSIIPDFNYAHDSLPDFDVFVIPAAEDHLDAALENDSLLSMIRDLGGKAEYVISLCDGAFPLVKSGLVDGLEVTTFPGDQEALRSSFPQVNVHNDVSFIRDGKFITSVGGAKSFDACLYLVQKLYGTGGAAKTAEGMVIDWDLNGVRHKEFN
ncbi:MAG: transcriptional regulator GlxA family with amidase domain [Parvicellaceae bacterium]|jgi:transcriptional regulator GlxA family with amidase domain